MRTLIPIMVNVVGRPPRGKSPNPTPHTHTFISLHIHTYTLGPGIVGLTFFPEFGGHTLSNQKVVQPPLSRESFGSCFSSFAVDLQIGTKLHPADVCVCVCVCVCTHVCAWVRVVCVCVVVCITCAIRAPAYVVMQCVTHAHTPNTHPHPHTHPHTHTPRNTQIPSLSRTKCHLVSVVDPAWPGTTRHDQRHPLPPL
jgi:hypothetical protein